MMNLRNHYTYSNEDFQSMQFIHIDLAPSGIQFGINQSKKYNYNPNLVSINKITEKNYLCAHNIHLLLTRNVQIETEKSYRGCQRGSGLSV